MLSLLSCACLKIFKMILMRYWNTSAKQVIWMPSGILYFIIVPKYYFKIILVVTKHVKRKFTVHYSFIVPELVKFQLFRYLRPENSRSPYSPPPLLISPPVIGPFTCKQKNTSNYMPPEYKPSSRFCFKLDCKTVLFLGILDEAVKRKVLIETENVRLA